MLLALLAESDEEVRLTATQGLHAVGTIAAVPALRDAGDRGSAVGAQLARAAIAAIQARAAGAESGTLALAETSGGEVALVDSP